MKNRLSKILASCGVASRRGAEILIFDGDVRVNGQVILEPQTLVDSDIDKITVKGRAIGGPEGKVIYMLNKPAGFISSSRRFADDRLAIDLIKDDSRRLYTIGRLDKESKGLILITNDGHLAQAIMHPSFQIEKEYIVKTKNPVQESHLTLIAKGTVVEGAFCRPLKVSKLNDFTLSIIVKEGKKHEVRTFVLHAGLKIDELKRTRIGDLELGRLPLGAHRKLTENEMKKLVGSGKRKKSSQRHSPPRKTALAKEHSSPIESVGEEDDFE